MKKLFVLSTLIVLVVLIIFISYVHIRSNAIINKKYNIPLVDVVIPKDSVSIAAGSKIAHTRACYACHLDNLRGDIWEDSDTRTLVTANISKVIPQYSNAELFRLLRHGVKKDGTAVWEMPAGMFAKLSDSDTYRLIAHLRTVPPVENKLPKTHFRFKGRIKMIRGKELLPEATWVDHENSKEYKFAQNSSVVQQGNYLAITTCTECHGNDLRGAGAPPIIIAKAYKESEFVKFLKTGKALGNRELKMMSNACRDRFTYYSEDEIKSIYAFIMQLEK